MNEIKRRRIINMYISYYHDYNTYIRPLQEMRGITYITGVASWTETTNQLTLIKGEN
jgi:hypothetical protein